MIQTLNYFFYKFVPFNFLDAKTRPVSDRTVLCVYTEK